MNENGETHGIPERWVNNALWNCDQPTDVKKRGRTSRHYELMGPADDAREGSNTLVFATVTETQIATRKASVVFRLSTAWGCGDGTEGSSISARQTLARNIRKLVGAVPVFCSCRLGSLLSTRKACPRRCAVVLNMLSVAGNRSHVWVRVDSLKKKQWAEAGVRFRRASQHVGCFSRIHGDV